MRHAEGPTTMLASNVFTLPRSAVLLILSLLCAPAWSAEKITVLLDWFVNPDHGPLIVAQQKGFFREAGLEVTMVEPADPNNPPKLVAAGQAELAITYQPQLHLAAAEGLPLIRVATLVATPLTTLLVLEDGPVKSVKDLKGRKVGFSVGGFEDAILGAMLERHGLALTDVELINVNFSLSPSLISGQVDAVIGAYRNFELNQMDIVKRPGRAFYVEEHGVPPYDELVLVANPSSAAKPAVATFVRVLERAVQYLVNHPDEAWDAFKSYKDGLDDELNRRAWRDTLPRFALRPAALDVGRYRRFARFLTERGLVTSMPTVDTYAKVLE
jgi:putative hydroxymethylpyrimidine transport system substrate-binding protein